MLNPFLWITSRVRAAVVQGFAQGLEDIGATQEASIDPIQALANLQARLALPAPITPSEETEGSKKRGTKSS
jgi:hypothetical protein